MKNILDWIEENKQQFEGQEPRNMKLAKAYGIPDAFDPDLEQSEFLRPGETLEDWKPNPFLKPHADGGRAGYNDGQLVTPNVDGSRPGYQGPPGTIKKATGPTKKNVGDTSPVYNAETGHIHKRTNRWGTVYSNVDDTAARKKGRKTRILKEQGIQIKLLEETNKKKIFDPKKFAKANKISMKQLKDEARKLRNNIYDKRMLVAGKEMRATLEWIPDDLQAADNALTKMWKSKLIVDDRGKIENLFYDAFKNGSISSKKYLAIRDNLTEYYQLRDAIKARYPHINLALDHPLSKSSLKNLFNASADQLIRVNPLEFDLNNGFKDSLSRQYELSVKNKNLNQKKAVEKIARDLKLNIGKISDDATNFKYGVKEFQKLNMKDEILKAVQNQADLSSNFKNYVKQHPDLFKTANVNPNANINKITQGQVKQIGKLLNNFWCRSPKASGGRIGFSSGSGCPDSVKRKNFLKMTNDVAKGKVTGKAAEEITKNAGKVVAKAGSKSALASIFGPAGFGIDIAYEVGSIGFDMAMDSNVSLKGALQNNWLTGAFIPGTGQEEYHKGLVKFDSRAKPMATIQNLIEKIESEEKNLERMKTNLVRGDYTGEAKKEILAKQEEVIKNLYNDIDKVARKDAGPRGENVRYLALEEGSPEKVAYDQAKQEYDSIGAARTSQGQDRGIDITSSIDQTMAPEKEILGKYTSEAKGPTLLKRKSKHGFKESLKTSRAEPWIDFGLSINPQYGKYSKREIDERLKQFGDYYGYGWTPYGLNYGMQQMQPGIRDDMRYNKDLGYEEVADAMMKNEAWENLSKGAPNMASGGRAGYMGGGIAGIRKPHAIPPERQGLRSIMINVNDD